MPSRNGKQRLEPRLNGQGVRLFTSAPGRAAPAVDDPRRYDWQCIAGVSPNGTSPTLTQRTRAMHRQNAALATPTLPSTRLALGEVSIELSPQQATWLLVGRACPIALCSTSASHCPEAGTPRRSGGVFQKKRHSPWINRTEKSQMGPLSEQTSGLGREPGAKAIVPRS